MRSTTPRLRDCRQLQGLAVSEPTGVAISGGDKTSLHVALILAVLAQAAPGLDSS